MLPRYMNSVDIPESVPRGPALRWFVSLLFCFLMCQEAFAKLDKREREANLSLMEEYCRLSNASEMSKDINTACFDCLRVYSRRDVACTSASSADFPSLNPYCSGCWNFLPLIGS
ncbi:hypothetical protein AVEN_211253-1 [Araneus ventricosus]|uniref:Uncharacterized protein n=1 Tax=Araneus ventricosus TaxID=182803 RepID=A0A4Y2E528_ARAVE|nr:hypothetical protein AVEN_211253-1 [Araneus ventricosus]